VKEFKNNWFIQLKVWLRALVRDPKQFFRYRDKFQCSFCGYRGYFVTARRGYIHGPFRCPNCESRPRDRNIALFFQKNALSFDGKNILHIAPEWPLFRQLKAEPGYVGGDIQKRRNANSIVDVTSINFEQNHFDFLICNHVLEHVQDDKKAMKECYRVLKKGGIAIFSVPLSGKSETWEPPVGMSVPEIEGIVGWDHKRYYGYDFADKLEKFGFKVEIFRITEAEAKRHGIGSGDINDEIFIAKK
jgi:SAM-dependent methyltransferase